MKDVIGVESDDDAIQLVVPEPIVTVAAAVVVPADKVAVVLAAADVT